MRRGELRQLRLKLNLLLRRSPARREPLAEGLVAEAEDDLGRRDALLDELRALAAAHAEDAAVRERLANGLFNTLVDAKAEDDLGRRDARGLSGPALLLSRQSMLPIFYRSVGCC